MSEWYDWCKANHVCYRCGKERADKGYTTCLTCRMALRERKKELRKDHINPSEIAMHKKQKEQQQKNRDQGLCACGKPTTDGYKTCTACRVKARIAATRRRRRKGIEPRKMWLDAGKCWICGAPVKEDYKLCEKHYNLLMVNGYRGHSDIFDKENQLHFARRDYEKKNMYRCGMAHTEKKNSDCV